MTRIPNSVVAASVSPLGVGRKFGVVPSSTPSPPGETQRLYGRLQICATMSPLYSPARLTNHCAHSNFLGRRHSRRYNLPVRHSSEPPPSSTQSKPLLFATTHWSVVLAVGQTDSPGSAQALERLCSTYWYPLYAYVRRRGYSQEDALDLTQSFFAHLLKRDALKQVSSEKGKFRSFLLASLNYFLADVRDRSLAQKRGGGLEVISFDAQEAEERYRLEPVDSRSSDRIFERRWALTMLDQVLSRLEQEFVAAGKAGHFQKLRGFLVEGAGSNTYAKATCELGLTKDAVKKAVQRMRRRYSELFREEVTNTVANSAEADEELRYLCAIMTEE
ncbi:MAG: sigma-70 family RNA polymerase sigma factor [Verrucomicrobia bacterium]|nr:sigma-70 family RNA polymerase sigma factor [Verrucomicrobiota bacterium]